MLLTEDEYRRSTGKTVAMLDAIGFRDVDSEAGTPHG